MMKTKLITFAYSLLLFFTVSSSASAAEDFDLRHTYAVVWTIDTDDAELYKHTIAAQATKTLELWTKGVVENVYLDNKESSDEVIRKGNKSKVMFFIKAKTEDEAKKILNEMPLVQKKLATYALHPVGVLWLKQF